MGGRSRRLYKHDGSQPGHWPLDACTTGPPTHPSTRNAGGILHLILGSNDTRASLTLKSVPHPKERASLTL